VGVVAAFFTYRVIPGPKPVKKGNMVKKFDVAGSLISFLAIAILTFVLSQGSDMGWASLKTILLFLVFISLFVTLIFIEKKQIPCF
jgi:hypothetical protein